MRWIVSLVFLVTPTLACIGGSSGGGCCSSPSSCAPSAPSCGDAAPAPAQYASASNSYPRPPVGAGGAYAAPPAAASAPFSVFPPAPPALQLLPGAPIGAYQQAPALPVLDTRQLGAYQAGPAAPIIAPIQQQASAQQIGAASYLTGPSDGGAHTGSYVGSAAVITEPEEETKEVVPAVAPSYGEKAVIKEGPKTASKQSETAVITDDSYGEKQEKEAYIEQARLVPAAPVKEEQAAVKAEEKITDGEEGVEYEYEEEETVAPVTIAAKPAVTDNYKAAAVEQKGKTEHNAGSEAQLRSVSDEHSTYSAEEEEAATAAETSYEAIELDGVDEKPKTIAEPAVVESAYSDEDVEEEPVKSAKQKEDYKRNTLNKRA